MDNVYRIAIALFLYELIRWIGKRIILRYMPSKRERALYHKFEGGYKPPSITCEPSQSKLYAPTREKSKEPTISEIEPDEQPPNIKISHNRIASTNSANDAYLQRIKSSFTDSAQYADIVREKG